MPENDLDRIERIDEIAQGLIREAIEFRGSDWMSEYDNARLRLLLDDDTLEAEDRYQRILDVVEELADDRAVILYSHRQARSPEPCRHEVNELAAIILSPIMGAGVCIHCGVKVRLRGVRDDLESATWYTTDELEAHV